MALLVETGIGSAVAESYCSVAYFLQYHADRGNAAAALMPVAEIEAALRKATDYMLQAYRNRWKGYRSNLSQALDWPRWGVTVDGYTFTYVNPSIVPAEVQKACAELALKSVTGALLADVTNMVLKKSVGSLSVEYDKASPVNPIYSAIDGMLAPFLANSGSRSVVGLVRS